MEYIARIHTPFPEKFGIPRQSGLAANAKGTIVFEPKFRNPDFASVAFVGVFQGQAGNFSCYGSTTAARRQGTEGRVCNTVPVSSEFHRPFLCETRKGTDR